VKAWETLLKKDAPLFLISAAPAGWPLFHGSGSFLFRGTAVGPVFTWPEAPDSDEAILLPPFSCLSWVFDSFCLNGHNQLYLASSAFLNLREITNPDDGEYTWLATTITTDSRESLSGRSAPGFTALRARRCRPGRSTAFPVRAAPRFALKAVIPTS
jgi:hypothetical protein